MSFMLRRGWHCQFLEQDLKNNYPQGLANIQAAKTPEDATRAGLPYEFGDGSSPSSAGLYAQHAGERVAMGRGIYNNYQQNSVGFTIRRMLRPHSDSESLAPTGLFDHTQPIRPLLIP